ncbi:hypothetical protein [Blastomonas sp.]|uniref:hypothetical protein n=1 Tax=Blastomonas sp. TaxID=1909299 RepID=UPI003593E364
MKLAKTALAALALTTMVSAPVLAQVATSVSRTASIASEDSEAEGSTGIIIGVVAAAAVIGGIIIIADDDEPSSP